MNRIPFGLLNFARQIRHQNKDLRYHNYCMWLIVYNPDWLDKYCEKRRRK